MLVKSVYTNILNNSKELLSEGGIDNRITISIILSIIEVYNILENAIFSSGTEYIPLFMVPINDPNSIAIYLLFYNSVKK